MEGRIRKILFAFILLTVFLVGFCFFINLAFAADSDLIITEIMYDPNGTDTGKEWVELYSKGADDIKIKSGSCSTNCWRFIDQFKDGLPNSSHRHTFSEDEIIKPTEFLIFATDKDTFRQNYPDYTGKLIKSSFSLLNEGSALALSSDGGTTYFSKTDYEKSWGGSGNGKTLEKIDFEKAPEKSNWQESFVLGGTPGEKSSEKKTYSKKLKISELLPNPSNTEEDDEFIEIFNGDDKEIDLTGWVLEDKAGNTYILGKVPLQSGKYLAVYRKDFGFALNNTSEEMVILKDPNGDEVDKVSYEESAKEDYSYSLDNDKFSWTSTPTPGKENVITGPEKNQAENLSTAEKVYLNEIFPNPKGDESSGEFIEVVNKEDVAVDLYKWTIRDASKTGKYVFNDHSVINPNEYLIIYRPQFKIALNNSAESVYLYNPAGKLTSSVSYVKAPENVSYNFDGIDWHWSKFLTPGAENKFDKPPKIRVKKLKRVYKGMYAQFQVKAKDKETKKLKYVWDFGDGHKSYLKVTSHKYLKIGKYRVKLSIKDESQTVEKNFSVRVKKYPRPKIEIIELTPNPSGRDTEFETLILKNNSGKKVDLKDYKIATGSKNLYNHPIYESLALQPGEEKLITRQDSKFTLNNKIGKVQLVYPDGKVADSAEYAKDKIKDDETFAKVEGKWQWIAPPEVSNTEDKVAENKSENIAENSQQIGGEVLGASTENDTYAYSRSVYTSEDAFIFFKLFGLLESKPQEINYCPANESPITLAYLLIPNFR